MSNDVDIYLVYIGELKSTLQTDGREVRFFKRNEIYPKPLSMDFVQRLFDTLPGQFRPATHIEVKALEDKLAGIVRRPVGKPKGFKKREFLKHD
jgi:hypothetical protein